MVFWVTMPITAITNLSTTAVTIFTQIYRNKSANVKEKNTFKSLVNIYFFIIYFFTLQPKSSWFLFSIGKSTLFVKLQFQFRHLKQTIIPYRYLPLESQIRTLTIRAWTCKHWFSIRIWLSCLPTHPFFRLAAI